MKTRRNRPSDEQISNVIIGSFLAIILIVVIALSLGCSVHPDPIKIGTGYDIPVIAEKFEKEVTEPVVKDGKEEKIETIITVPPSDKPTVVKVYKKDLSTYQKLMTNEPSHSVESDNKNVTAEQPKKRGLWKRWIVFIIGIIAVLGAAVLWIWNKVKNFSPVGMVKSIVKKFLSKRTEVK